MSGTNSQSNNPTDPLVVDEPVTVDGTVDIGNQFDDEYEVLCDNNGAFVRRLRTNSAGAVTVANFTLGGGAYVPVGTVRSCATVTNGYAVLCDTVGPFLRQYSTNEAGTFSVTSLTLAGVLYVPVGAVGICPQTVSGSVTVSNLRDDELEILCDAGAANLPFIRRYRTDSAGVVTSANFTLDGTTPYVLVGAAARCTAVTGTVSVSNLAADDEMEVLCDAGAANLPFLRQYAYPPGGGAPVVSNFALDGVTPYVVIGPVARCTSVTVTNFPATQPISGSVSLLNQFDDEYQVLCDTTPTTFIRRFRTDSAGVVTVANFTLAGGAFVPVGAVGNCATAGSVTVSNQSDDEWEVLCDAGAAGAQFLRRYRTDSTGTVTSANFLLDGTTAYVVLGVATACRGISGVVPLPTGAATLAAQRDDEWVVLCDNNGPFSRRYRTDSAGAVTKADFLLDGTTAYVTVGTIVVCGDVTNFPLSRSVVVLCDNNGAFLRRYNITSAGVVTKTDTLLDGSTVYVTVGTIKSCSPSASNSTLTWSTVNLGSGAVNVGAGSKGWTAALNVATAVTPAATDTGTVGGQTVPVGYSVGIDADEGQTVVNNTALTAAGVAFWTVVVRT